jgi:hypothetical protein
MVSPPRARGPHASAVYYRSSAKTSLLAAHVTGEIESATRQRIGDAVLVYEGADLVAFAICHLGQGSEAAVSRPCCKASQCNRAMLLASTAPIAL